VTAPRNTAAERRSASGRNWPRSPENRASRPPSLRRPATATDDGLKTLHGLANLQELDLTGTKVTAEGVAALQKDLPKRHILSAPAK